MKISDLNLDLIDTINLYNGLNEKERSFLIKLLDIMKTSVSNEKQVSEILEQKKFVVEMKDFLEESLNLKAPKEDIQLIRSIFNIATNHLGDNWKNSRSTIADFLTKSIHRYGEGLIEDFRQKDL